MLEKLEKIILVAVVMILTGVVFLGVVARYLPLRGGILLLGTEELGRLGLVWLWAWGGGRGYGGWWEGGRGGGYGWCWGRG